MAIWYPSPSRNVPVRMQSPESALTAPYAFSRFMDKILIDQRPFPNWHGAGIVDKKYLVLIPQKGLQTAAMLLQHFAWNYFFHIKNRHYFHYFCCTFFKGEKWEWVGVMGLPRKHCVHYAQIPLIKIANHKWTHRSFWSNRLSANSRKCTFAPKCHPLQIASKCAIFP